LGLFFRFGFILAEFRIGMWLRRDLQELAKHSLKFRSLVGSFSAMRDDLLHALASVDWAVSNLPAFKARIDAWLNGNVHLVLREQPADVANDVLVAEEKAPLPLEFQVEAGAYINAVRSSLDILAATLAQRHCQTLIDKAYFPVAFSEQHWIGRNFKGKELIKSLPAKETRIIEALKPYNGGNELLSALHNLDIVRKHVRLLTSEIRPQHMMISGWGEITKNFTFIAGGFLKSGAGDTETIIGLLAKGVEKPKIKLTMQVSLSETLYLPRREVVTAIRQFANLARGIIRDFDY
jgi:hypothetical protein